MLMAVDSKTPDPVEVSGYRVCGEVATSPNSNHLPFPLVAVQNLAIHEALDG
jgi:hypothetical protein